MPQSIVHLSTFCMYDASDEKYSQCSVVSAHSYFPSHMWFVGSGLQLRSVEMSHRTMPPNSTQIWNNTHEQNRLWLGLLSSPVLVPKVGFVTT